jgi:hypothetical protein
MRVKKERKDPFAALRGDRVGEQVKLPLAFEQPRLGVFSPCHVPRHAGHAKRLLFVIEDRSASHGNPMHRSIRPNAAIFDIVIGTGLERRLHREKCRIAVGGIYGGEQILIGKGRVRGASKNRLALRRGHEPAAWNIEGPGTELAGC